MMGRLIVIQDGDTFGDWIVIHRDYTNMGGGKKGVVYYKCKCSCGRVVSVNGASLRKGFSICCGKCGLPQIGNTYYGNLVLDRLPDKKEGSCTRTQFLCKCGACGREFIARGWELVHGHYKTCGKCNGVDIGMRFGAGVVLKEIEPKRHKDGRNSRRYVLQCDCGRSYTVTTSVLNQSIYSACGQCHVPKLGDVIGRLTVVDYVYGLYIVQGLRTITQCVCKCSCGNPDLHSILMCNFGKNCSRPTESCGCKRAEKSAERALINLPPRRGADNPRWKNGITPLSRAIRNCAEYLDWVKRVFERDNYICQVSNQIGNGDLNVHHITPFYQLIEENNITTLDEARNCKEFWDISNGITLTRKWHLQGQNNQPNSFHNRLGVQDFTQEDFRDWYMQL